MAHSIELLLDAQTDAAIRSDWQNLADAGLPSQLRVGSPTNRPHVTLLAAPWIDADVDDALRALSRRLPLPCRVGAPVVFTGPRMVLARLIVPSAALLNLHQEVCRICLPRLNGEPFGHCLPGNWTAHVTLGRRLPAADIGAALAVTAGADLVARFVGLRRWDGDNRIDHLLVG